MKRTLGFALLFTAAYLLIFSSPLRKEPVFKPVWVQNLADPVTVSAPENAPNIGFRIGDIFGYTTPNGAIKYLNTTQFNVAMDNGRFINYSSVSKNLVEKDASGRITLTVGSDGYPLFRAGRFFVMSTDRTALSELNGQGSALWSRDFGSLITTLDASPDDLVVGLLNGSIEVIDKQGKETFHYRPSGSKFSAIYGSAISNSDGLLALISGLDPQRFILLERDGKSSYRPLKVVDLGSDMRRQVYLHFYPGLPYVYVELPNAVEYFSTSGASSGTIPMKGRIAAMGAHDGLVYAVSSGDASSASRAKGKAVQEAVLTVFTPTGRVISSQAFAGGALFLKTLGRSIYIGAGRRLMRIDFGVE